jgi:hypothetical protein
VTSATCGVIQAIDDSAYHSQGKEFLERVASVDVLVSVCEIVEGEQHLSAGKPTGGEDVFIKAHEMSLPDGCKRLALGEHGGSRFETEFLSAHADCPGRNDHDVVICISQTSHSVAKSSDRTEIQRSALCLNQGGRADFDHNLRKRRRNRPRVSIIASKPKLDET